MAESNEKKLSLNNNFDIDNFLISEYNALREEISKSKKNIFNLLSFGVISLPLIIGAGFKYELDFLIIISPLIVLIFELLLVFEQNSIMRAGAYIYDIVEKRYCIGWEHWLESFNDDVKDSDDYPADYPKPRTDPRKAELFFTSCAHIVFLFYYIGSVFLSFIKSSEVFNIIAATFFTGFYACLLIVTLIFLFWKKNFPKGTDIYRHKKVKKSLG